MDEPFVSGKANRDSDLRSERRLRRRSLRNRSFKPSVRENALRVQKKSQGQEMLGFVHRSNISSSIYEDDCFKGNYVNLVSDDDDDDDVKHPHYVNLVSDDDDDVEDPQYKMFLENMTQVGNSYALKVLQENGGPEVINYEIYHSLPDLPRPETPKTIESRSVNGKTNKGKRILREVCNGEILASANGSAHSSSEQVVSSERSLRYWTRNEKNKSLRNLMERGNSYALKVFSGNDEPEVINYELDDWVPNLSRQDTPKTIESCQMNCETGQGKRILWDVSDGERFESLNDRASFSSEEVVWSKRSLRYFARNEKKDILKPSADIPLKPSETPKTIQRCPVNCKTNKGKIISRDVIDVEIVESVNEVNISSEEVVRSERSLRYQARTEKKDSLKLSDDEPIKRRKTRSGTGEASGGASGGCGRRSGPEGNHFVEQDDDTCEEPIRFVEKIASSSALRKAPSRTSGRSRRRPSTKHYSFVEQDDDTCEEYVRFLNGTGGDSSGAPSLKCNDFDDREREVDNEDVARKPPSRASGRCRSTKHYSFVELEDDTCEEYIRFLNGTSGGSCRGPRSTCNGFDDCEGEVAFDDESYLRLLNPHSDAASGPSNANAGSDGSQISDLEKDEIGDGVSEYMEYLDLLEAKGEDVMYKTDDSPCRFGEVEESESDSDMVVADNDPYGAGDSTPFESSQPSKYIDLDGDGLVEDLCIASRAQFKKELIEVLKRPYDSKQHESFLQEVRCRKPIREEKNLRGRIKLFPSATKLARSYLDLHEDFAKLLDLVKNDTRKSLNLLRGFFYWLNNLVRDGAFKPWKDPSILEVLPQQ